MNFPIQARYPSRRSPVMADRVVSTSQPLATQAGIAMFAAGGNAVDAALGAAIALTVVEPTGCGVGSDAFAIVSEAGRLTALNASGRAPAAWTPDRFRDAPMPDRGWETVTVPGAVSAWVALSRRHGRLPFAQLFEPAVALCRRGFPVSPVIAEVWANGAGTLATQPGFAEHFMPHGEVPAAGERFANPNLAATLRDIAESEGRSFYEGSLAERIAADAARHGSALSLDDLANHRADWCETLAIDFDACRLHELPPNGQGIAALMALGILRRTPVRDYACDSVDGLHWAIEAMKLAFADVEAYVADPSAMQPVDAESLLEADYLASRAERIDPTRASDFGAGAPPTGGTVYLATADADGTMVSFIQSNYEGFGSGVVVPGTGIHLQNRACGFSTDPAHPNHVDGGKRPFHTIIPAFAARDGAPWMAFGVMGGPMQAQGHVQMILRTSLHREDVQSAVDAPRWRVDGGLDVACEAGFAPRVLEGLRERGHRIAIESGDGVFGFGGAQLVQRLPGGGYVAGSDPRKDGCAAGF